MKKKRSGGLFGIKITARLLLQIYRAIVISTNIITFICRCVLEPYLNTYVSLRNDLLKIALLRYYAHYTAVFVR